MERSTPTILHLIEGDCVSVMHTMPEKSIDVVVTSPPYNIGTGYSGYTDVRDVGEFLDWCVQWGGLVKSLMAPGASFFLNVGAQPSSPLLPYRMLLAMTDRVGFVLQNTLHWVKSATLQTPDGLVSAGHFKPINSKRFVNDCHEFVFHLTVEGNTPVDRLAVGVPYADKSNTRRWQAAGGSDCRCRGNVWHIPYKTIQSRADQRPHPATFPSQLPSMCLSLHGKLPTLRVMDPFMGIGNSAVAAKELGVAEFTGIEIDPDYLKISRERINPHVTDGN